MDGQWAILFTAAICGWVLLLLTHCLTVRSYRQRLEDKDDHIKWLRLENDRLTRRLVEAREDNRR